MQIEESEDQKRNILAVSYLLAVRVQSCGIVESPNHLSRVHVEILYIFKIM
jgi:hypothetical protein